MSLVDPALLDSVNPNHVAPNAQVANDPEHMHIAQPASGQPQMVGAHQQQRPPTSAEIDAVIAAAMANAPPAPPPIELGVETSTRSLTPLMTNILPSAIGSDGRVNLFVGNLPYRVRWQDLKDLFRKAGTVLRADVSLGPDNRSRGYGNVLMGSREDAARAIDRFNGFTWQTRTLEVRPDRLPPEYEPQPHVHHKPMYGFMPPQMQHFGGGGWPARPPPHHGPPFGSFGAHLGPPHGGGPSQAFNRAPQMGGHVGAIPPIGASPLAGSLTAGAQGNHGPPAGASGSTTPWGAREGGLAPFGGLGDPSAAHPVRSPSPLGNLPVPGDGKRPASPAPPADPIGRGPPLGRIPPPNLLTAGGVKNAFSPEPETQPLRRLSAGSEANAAHPIGPPPISLNGLASQGKDLGAPGTLVDRVVFVKNLSLTTQWQDLKDLFRPAGVVIRADVATGLDGQSRGFGTVLFASKDDALKAVGMFNGHEVDGRILHVQTERQTLEDKQIQPIHPVDPFPVFGSKTSPSPQVWSQQPLPPLAMAASSASPETFPQPAMSNPSLSPGAGTRIPWQLNTAINSSPASAPRKEGGDDPFQRPSRHPGPIQLPPFAPLGDVGNPLSPLQTRNLPPMTPSMPGFVFNAYPQTPPLHPQFLSPGLGPFSPGLPVTSPLVGRRSPFLNAAPGAPVAPAQAGSAALGTPTTQAFPHNAPPQHPTVGPPGGGEAEYFPRVEAPQVNRLVPAASPLNARERLASSAAGAVVADEDLLVSSTASLSLLGEAVSITGTANSSPTPQSKTKRGLAPGTSAAAVGAPAATNGRSSFDDGPRQPLGAWNSERRASWSDLSGAGGAGGAGTGAGAGAGGSSSSQS